MPEPIVTETWTEDGETWGVYGFTCDTCGGPICIVATVATWEAGLTAFQRDRIRDNGTVTCVGCDPTPAIAMHPDGSPVEEVES